MSEQKTSPTDLSYKVTVDVDPKPIARASEERSLNYEHIESWVRYLLGHMLTLMDASFSDVQQRKAVKDLVRKQFREHLNEIAGACELSRSVNSEPLNTT